MRKMGDWSMKPSDGFARWSVDATHGDLNADGTDVVCGVLRDREPAPLLEVLGPPVA